jgi:hypothetical protein
VNGHHDANVDRLWNRWLDIRGHDLPDQTADQGWCDQAFPLSDDKENQVT